MNWNISIAVAIAALVVFTSALGGHLASTKPWHKWVFWGFGGLMLVLITIQTVVNEHAQQKLQGQLDRIQHNTEQPPTVNVNLPQPPAPREHTRVQFIELQQTFEFPLWPYHKDQKLALAIGYENVGDFAVADPKMDAAVLLMPRGAQDKTFKKTRAGFKFRDSPSGGTLNPHVRRGLYNSYFGPTLTEDDVSKLNSGQMQLCGVAAVIWRDASGRYETDFDECFAGDLGVGFNLHSGANNNVEHKLK